MDADSFYSANTPSESITIDLPYLSTRNEAFKSDADTSTHATGSEMTLDDIRYTVRVGNAEKTILRNLSPIIPAGSLTALMGSTVGGKSTLLDTLAGRKDPKDISGRILQDVIVSGSLTVRENLLFSVRLRLSNEMVDVEKHLRVDTVIAEFGLSKVANRSCRCTQPKNPETSDANKSLAEKFLESEPYLETLEMVKKRTQPTTVHCDADISASADDSLTITYPIGYFQQTCIIVARNIRNSIRNPAAALMQTVGEHRVWATRGHVVFPEAYFTAKVVVDLLLGRLIPTLFYSVISFTIIGLSGGFTEFLVYLMMLELSAMTAVGICFLVSSLVDVFAVANVLTTMVYAVMLVFVGLFMNLDTMAKWFSWIQYVSLFRYGYEALAANELAGMVFDCSADVPCQSGDQYLATQGFEDRLWFDVGMLTLF
ncbi:hypothetical protein SARC_06046 [Sphaeroforma arctica JP610]|uniref:ABC-2 type transporter transmembrane domain-containing protein n=1 Tax=Sphaeroforma arctica JP610 TaxID=667725 RepID=A0A0L0FYL6_9EUKA|nr:hypothetical protein SARC_06046 [Sphaeroforma arctica JP610]KNC81641.1 hypothetical protein SARC_06046 [Sphaeroforma arctica JP610]|eukprot:XP_014155543.1 hypothetical protein SARC_06046 [Sphaeroforma arctica JP610]